MNVEKSELTDAPALHTLRRIVGTCALLDLDRPQSLGTLERFRSERILVGWQEWALLRDSFTVGEVVLLAQVLTIMERQFKWPGGSVSSVVWIMQDLYSRERTIAELLSDWIVQRTQNDYLPFGKHSSRRDWIRNRTPCVDLTEFRDRAARIRESDSAGTVPTQAHQADGLARAAEMAKAAHSLRKGQQDESGERNGSSMASGAAEQLRLVAFDLRHPLDFFPKDWAKIADKDLLQLDAGVRTALTDRLKTTKVVTWRRLHNRLSKIKAAPAEPGT